MLVRAKELCIVAGSRRRAGQVFDYKGPLPHKYLDPIVAEEGAPAPDLGPVVEEPKQQMGSKKQKKTDDMTIHEIASSIPSVI